MTKLQLLHRALNERMMAAVEQIMELVGGTVLEYEEETTRMRKENEVLRRRLQSLEEANRSNWTGQCDSVTQFQQEQCAVSFEFGQESEAVVIKTENPDDPLYIRSVNSLATLPQSTDQGSPVAGTSASFTDSQKESMKCPSTQDYMEPVEFDPTSSIRFTNRGEREKRQRMSFACPDCGKKFGREQTLMFHLRTHSTEKPYEYRRRKKSFYGNGLTKKKLQGYSQIPSENTENVLDCSASVSRNSPPAEHLTGVQESDSLSTTSYGSSNENDPENTASNPEPQGKKGKNILKKKYDCSFCGDVFLTPEQLEFHKRSHLVDAGKALIPPSEEQDLKIPGTEDEVPQKSSCPHCSKTYSQMECLRTHIQTAHSERTTSNYFEIIPSFGRTRSQKTLTQKNAEVRAYTCCICPKAFFSSIGLKRHMLVHVHEGETVPQKESKMGRMQINKAKATKQAMNMDDGSHFNVERVKPNSKVYACQHCPAKFYRKYTLRRHVYIHTGERPFWCHECNIGFIQKYRLSHHTISYHGTPLSTDQGIGTKRGVHGENKTIEETRQDLLAESPARLSDDVDMGTEPISSSNPATAKFHSEEASPPLQLE